ncbi:MAG: acyl-CoA dehydrogenase, partial [Hyphomonadaceae bacterium]
MADHNAAIMDGLSNAMSEAVSELEAWYETARNAATKTLAPSGKPDRKLLDTHQHMAHGLAWIATYVETLRQVAHWAGELESNGAFGEIEHLL